MTSVTYRVLLEPSSSRSGQPELWREGVPHRSRTRSENLHTCTVERLRFRTVPRFLSTYGPPGAVPLGKTGVTSGPSRSYLTHRRNLIGVRFQAGADLRSVGVALARSVQQDRRI